MAKNFILSTNPVLSLIDNKYYLLSDIGLSKLDILALVIEYLEYSSNGGISVEDYLYSSWLLESNIVDKLSHFIDIIIEDIAIFCPELIDVLRNNGRMHISHYDKHMFVLQR